MRAVIFTNSAASIHTFDWLVDRDCTLKLAHAAGNTWAVSNDPLMTQALPPAPTVTEIREGLLIIPQSGTPPILSIPLKKDSHLFAACAAAKGTLICYLEDDVPAE